MIAGIEPCSFVDFPGRIAAVLFLQGCNLHCPYCHNPELISTPRHPLLTVDAVLAWLDRRVGRLSGVVMSGGEPTLQAELPQLITAIRARGYRVKLDTNGTRPDVLRATLDASLVDYVALDIKDVPGRYAGWLSSGNVTSAILESTTVLKRSGVAHEFRTTVLPGRHDIDSLDRIRHILGNDARWYLQIAQAGRTSASMSQQLQRESVSALAVELRCRGAENLHVRGETQSFRQ